MIQKTDFYINGEWIAPIEANKFSVINPANETAFATISLGSVSDLNKAVSAAKAAFLNWSRTPLSERIEMVKKLLSIYESRANEMAEAISSEMGAPIKLAINAQTAAGAGHIKAFIKALESFEFEHTLRPDAPDEYIIREPVSYTHLTLPTKRIV